MTTSGERYYQSSFYLEESGAQSEHNQSALQLRRLHAGLAPYLDTTSLRRLVAEQGDLSAALRGPIVPAEVRDLLDTLVAILHPRPKEKIRSSADVAGLLMVEMSQLDREEFRTVLLDTKGHVQKIITVYRGSIDASIVRAAEVFKDAVLSNSASIIGCHNHPSGDPTPSPEDVIVTHHLVKAGEILEIEFMDHLILGDGRYVSMRERKLGY